MYSWSSASAWTRGGRAVVDLRDQPVGSSIGDDKFLEYLQRLFVEYAIPPRMICFEITETSAIANLGSAIRFINELKGWLPLAR